MRKLIIAALLSLTFGPGLALADPWKDESGKGRGKDHWKQRDDWNKDQRKREKEYWKDQQKLRKEAEKRDSEWQRDDGYYRPRYEARRPIYPPYPYYPGPDGRYYQHDPFDDDWYDDDDGYRPRAQGRMGPHRFEFWW
jgi:hypothetical protein